MDRPDGRRRVVIENVTPRVDDGRFPVKRVQGETVTIEADVFADGHDAVACVMLYRGPGETAWTEVSMEPLRNDRWRAEFRIADLGIYHYTIEGWTDRFLTWTRDMARRLEATNQDLEPELEMGALLLDQAAGRATGTDAARLKKWAASLRSRTDVQARGQVALDPELAAAAARWPDRRFATRHDNEFRVRAERPRARYSTWYELFPRSASANPGQHGTFADVERRLAYIADMGFDVLYLPPIHPIGRAFRKGPNNTLTASETDVGSPWAIGSDAGGHTAIHPSLGSFADFERLRQAAEQRGIELALDLAYQCSPDHPWVTEHPEWFRHRPDGSIQYAENPPKKYQDIYPIDFESEDWPSLWEGLKQVVLFWCGKGIRIFRVDNPHTKAFPFWEWMIGEVQSAYPDTIFLSEAFTRPKVMYRLAKLGFSQSYTYFSWRNTGKELVDYFTEIAGPVRQFFRPNLWPATPDILTEYLQMGGRPAFQVRVILAATLGASYGIYGPAYELGDNQPRSAGSEEYLDSEKYQIREWDLESPASLRPLITRLNRARRENPALQADQGLTFHPVNNPLLLCYSKTSEEGTNTVLTVVNLDLQHRQSGWVHLELGAMGLEEGQAFQVHDELSDSRYLWQGSANFVELDPAVMPAHLFRIRLQVRSERNFDYYL